MTAERKMKTSGGEPRTTKTVANCLNVSTARLAGNNALDVFQRHREKELGTLPEALSPFPSWATWKEGLPLTIAAGSEDDLPANMRFHEEKRLDFKWTLKAG